MILYASAFVHAKRGNTHGVGAQLEKAERKLASYRPYYLGIDVDALLAHAARCREIVARSTPADAYALLHVVEVPRIVLDVRRVRGDEPELRPGKATSR